MNLEEVLIEQFPGLIDDTEVNGSDLVDFISAWLARDNNDNG